MGLARTMVDEIKEKCTLIIPYLSSKDRRKKTGTVNLCVIFSCYGHDKDGTRIVTPKRLGGMQVEIRLPLSKGEIENPLYSPVMSEYWLNFWMNRAGLYNNQVIEIAEKKLETRVSCLVGNFTAASMACQAGVCLCYLETVLEPNLKPWD